MKQQIEELILKVAASQNPSLPRPVAVEQGEFATLYGPGGALDSLALVRFIVELEEAIEDQFQTTLVLASERAMSRRHSPFLTVGSLADYIVQLLQETGGSPP
jgi:D-alanine--poly(phosphoribitol) ligase subunit 2